MTNIFWWLSGLAIFFTYFYFSSIDIWYFTFLCQVFWRNYTISVGFHILADMVYAIGSRRRVELALAPWQTDLLPYPYTKKREKKPFNQKFYEWQKWGSKSRNLKANIHLWKFILILSTLESKYSYISGTNPFTMDLVHYLSETENRNILIKEIVIGSKPFKSFLKCNGGESRKYQLTVMVSPEPGKYTPMRKLSTWSQLAIFGL